MNENIMISVFLYNLTQLKLFNPQLINSSSIMSDIDTQNLNQTPFSLINYEAQIEISENIDEYQKAKLATKKLDANPSPQDVLNNMIIPRDWESQGNKFFMQYVSHSKSSRDDVFTLKQKLQQALEHRQARNQGICPIRQELFSQAFDEIIRQVTINSPERGLLLMRVRDQHKMTLAAYQTLYKSSVDYGMRKQLESEEGMDELEEQLRRTQREHKRFMEKRIEMECKKQFLEKKIEERNMIEDSEREFQFHQINEQAKNLQLFLETIKQDKTKNISPQKNIKESEAKPQQ